MWSVLEQKSCQRILPQQRSMPQFANCRARHGSAPIWGVLPLPKNRLQTNETASGVSGFVLTYRFTGFCHSSVHCCRRNQLLACNELKAAAGHRDCANLGHLLSISFDAANNIAGGSWEVDAVSLNTQRFEDRLGQRATVVWIADHSGKRCITVLGTGEIQRQFAFLELGVEWIYLSGALLQGRENSIAIQSGKHTSYYLKGLWGFWQIKGEMHRWLTRAR